MVNAELGTTWREEKKYIKKIKKSFSFPPESFWLTKMSSTESFNLSKHTPLYKNEQNEREILQWRLQRSLSKTFLIVPL